MNKNGIDCLEYGSGGGGGGEQCVRFFFIKKV